MLTERRIRDAKPESKTRILWDGTVKGLGVRITPAGAKSYVLSYRSANRKRLATLARCAEISLRAARERAGEELSRIRAGETDPLERRREAIEAPTVADGLRRYFDEYVVERIAIGRMSERTVVDYRLQAGRYIEPALGKRKIAEVTRRHVELMVESLPRVQRNRVLALTSIVFNIFETWEWRPGYSNPTRGIPRSREESRDRVLAPSELAALSSALTETEAQHPAAVAAIRFAAVTGLRIGEVLAIEWEHVEFESGRLTLPRTKTGRRVHDLPAPALAILTALPRFNGYVFTTRGDVPVTYRWVRKVFLVAAQRAGLADVRIHDLRRGYMTNAAAAGVGAHALRDLLGHKETRIADAYIRAVGDPVRQAREQVSGAVAAMMDGNGGEVVPMGRRHG